MGVSTQGYIGRTIMAVDIYDVIVDKFDKDAKFDIKIEDRDGIAEEIGFIRFKDGEDERKIFLCYGEKEQHHTFDLDKYIFLTFGCWGRSSEVMIKIVGCFGGYVDENDCDEIDPIYVPQSENFQYIDYINERKNIAKILDNQLSQPLKIQIANQILKHKEQLKEIL